MKKKLIALALAGMLACSAACLCSCGGNEAGGDADKATEAEVTETEETVHAADPKTEEELEADDTGGCIEDSEDLLY